MPAAGLPRVLLAGATGCLGRALVPVLRARGHLVRALGRDASRLARLPAHETIVADALDVEAMRKACQGVDAVFSCLGASNQLSPRAGRQPFTVVDVRANQSLIDAARNNGVRRFAYVSLIAHPAMSRLDYVLAHERVVESLQRSGLDYTVIRPTGVFSAFEQMLHIALRGRLPEIRGGVARSNPIHADDLAAACADALDRGGAEHRIGGPEILSRRQMGALAFEAIGRAPRFFPAPPGLFRAAGWLARPFNPRIGHVLSFYAALGEYDLVAPAHGQRTLRSYFRERAAALAPPAIAGVS